MQTTPLAVDTNTRALTSVHELLSLEDKEFLRRAYVTLLRRLPDSGGMAHYLAQLESGASKSALLLELYKSEEGQRMRRMSSGPVLSGMETLLQSEQPRPLRLVPSLISRLAKTEDKKSGDRYLRELALRLSSVETQMDAKLAAIHLTIRDGLRPQVKETIQNLFGAFDPNSYLDANQDVRTAGMNAFEHYMRHGWRENRPLKREDHNRGTADYQEWIRRHDTLDSVCRAALEMRSQSLASRPLISIVMPTYNPRLEWLREAIDSVRKQIYANWQLCIADDCSTDPEVHRLLESYVKLDSRISVVFRPTNGHISAASNSALGAACGEWIALVDHDDILPEHALYFVAEAINQHPESCLFYSDEDKLDSEGQRYDPYFKCDWNPDLFYSHNLITHLGVYKKSIVDRIGGFREGYEGSQDYDLALRFIEKIAPSQVQHIPRVLYHWRAHPQSTAQASVAKPYAAVAGEKALTEHFGRLGIEARSEYCGYGYRTRYALPAKPRLVSLIIPTRNAHRLVRQCLESIRTKTTYRNYEIILVDNGSDDPESLRYFAALATENVRVIRDDRPFNYSALNNSAVKHARGEIIGLINNDIEVIEPDWLGEMVSHAERPEIGAVGAKLLYPDNTVQHAGVVLGIGGVAGHSHKYWDGEANGYFSRLKLISSFSAVTAACLVIRKSIYQEVGGLDEGNLAVAFNDVDFCLKVRKSGYRNVFTPYALLYHHESVSRGREDTPEKTQRFAKEVKYMKKKWANALRHDPAYSPNLTLEHEDFSLAPTARLEHLGDE